MSSYNSKIGLKSTKYKYLRKTRMTWFLNTLKVLNLDFFFNHYALILRMETF